MKTISPCDIDSYTLDYELFLYNYNFSNTINTTTIIVPDMN